MRQGGMRDGAFVRARSLQNVSGIYAGSCLVLLGERVYHGVHRAQRRGKDDDAQKYARPCSSGRRHGGDVRYGSPGKRIGLPPADRRGAGRRALLRLKAPARCGGDDGAVL